MTMIMMVVELAPVAEVGRWDSAVDQAAAAAAAVLVALEGEVEGAQGVRALTAAKQARAFPTVQTLKKGNV